MHRGEDHRGLAAAFSLNVPEAATGKQKTPDYAAGARYFLIFWKHNTKLGLKIKKGVMKCPSLLKPLH